MSKYDALRDYLKRQPLDRVPMSFADIERITDAKLPPSAHKHRPWWSNNSTNSAMTRVWLEAGFQSEQVDMAGQRLVFRRIASAPGAPLATAKSDTSPAQPIHPAYGALKGMVRIMPGTDLTAPADPDWGKSLDRDR